MRRSYVVCIAVTVVLALAAFAFGQGRPGQFPASAAALQKSPVLQGLRGPAAQSQIGKPVDLDGFFYDGSIPMIIDDIQRPMIDQIMPEDSYIPLVGQPLKGVRNGDRIRLRGARLERPSAADAPLRREPTVLRLGADATFTMLQASSLQLVQTYPISISTIQLLRNYYAVLIAGGWDAANSHIRYWNDLKTMYAILRNAGYPAENIYVLYADGVPRQNPSPMPVNFSATTANIQNVFTTLASKLGSYDTLYIMTNDHGSSDGSLCLWNYTTISPAAFAGQVNRIANYSKMIVQMKQCYNGAFMAPLTNPKRTLMASALANQVSYAHGTLQYGEFTYWYFTALLGKIPDGVTTYNADTNGDGKVSMTEAYNFARAHDAAPETPSFEDNGVAPPTQGNLTTTTPDGPRSFSIFLK